MIQACPRVKPKEPMASRRSSDHHVPKNVGSVDVFQDPGYFQSNAWTYGQVPIMVKYPLVNIQKASKGY